MINHVFRSISSCFFTISVSLEHLGYIGVLLAYDLFLVSDDESGEKRRVRGVVNGAKVAEYRHSYCKGQLIKVDMLPDGSMPDNQVVGSLLVHEIGSAVKDKLPMFAPSFKKLDKKYRSVVIDHLTVSILNLFV